jgi:hypothetical protein
MHHGCASLHAYMLEGSGAWWAQQGPTDPLPGQWALPLGGDTLGSLHVGYVLKYAHLMSVLLDCGPIKPCEVNMIH